MYFLTKLCCLCLNTNKSFNGLDILKNSKILNMLLFCVKDDFDTNSTIPKFICPNCCTKLEAAYQFKRMCLYNFHQFEVYVKQLQNYTNADHCPEIRTSFTDLKMLDDKIRKLMKWEQETREETKLYRNPKSFKLNESTLNKKNEYEQMKVTALDQGSSVVFNYPNTTYISKLHTLLSKETDERLKNALTNETNTQTNERGLNLNDRGKSYVDKLHNLLNQAKKTDECFEKVIGKETHKSRFKFTPMRQINPNEDTLKFRESYSISGTNYINKLSNLLISAKKADESFERVLGKKSEAEVEKCNNKEKSTRSTNRSNSTLEHPQTKDCLESSPDYEKLQDPNQQTTSRKRENTNECTDLNPVSDPFPCLICGKVYTVQNRLLRHMKMQHSPNSTVINQYELTCKRCGKTYSTAGSLRRHMKIQHTSDLPLHICPLCGNRYKEKSSLSTHMLIHNNQQRYSCQVCGKKYVNRTQYRSHMLRNHTECLESEERKFLTSCSVCGKYFPSKSHLDLHFLTHSNEALFSCATCSKKFLYKSTLKRHIIIAHTKCSEIYKCFKCGNQYSAQSTLKLHMLTHEDKLPYPCTMCDKAFLRRDKLKVHVWKAHNFKNSGTATNLQGVSNFPEGNLPNPIKTETNNFPDTFEHSTNPNFNEPVSSTLSAEYHRRIKLEPQEEDITIEENCFETVLINEDYLTLKREHTE